MSEIHLSEIQLYEINMNEIEALSKAIFALQIYEEAEAVDELTKIQEEYSQKSSQDSIYVQGPFQDSGERLTNILGNIFIVITASMFSLSLFFSTLFITGALRKPKIITEPLKIEVSPALKAHDLPIEVPIIKPILSDCKLIEPSSIHISFDQSVDNGLLICKFNTTCSDKSENCCRYWMNALIYKFDHESKKWIFLTAKSVDTMESSYAWNINNMNKYGKCQYSICSMITTDAAWEKKGKEFKAVWSQIEVK